MNQFFAESSAIKNGRIYLTGTDVNHIENVLRLRAGDRVSVVDNENGMTYTCSIEEMSPGSVVCLIEDMQNESRELPVKITLYQGLPKSDKFEFVIQKAVEMGASCIVPVEMKRSVVKLTSDKAEKKNKRWNAIAASAASQSKRNTIPAVGDLITFEDALKKAVSEGEVIVPYELAEGMDDTRKTLAGLKEKRTANISVFIGPEGGFDSSEIDMAEAAGAHLITLGRRILRTETAPLAILAWMIYIFEE